jgi:hypothetical protein
MRSPAVPAGTVVCVVATSVSPVVVFDWCVRGQHPRLPGTQYSVPEVVGALAPAPLATLDVCELGVDRGVRVLEVGTGRSPGVGVELAVVGAGDIRVDVDELIDVVGPVAG